VNPIYLVILLISVLLNGYFISRYTEEVESTAYIEENISYMPGLNAKTAISSISQDIEDNMFEMLSLKQYHESVKLLINADSNDAKITNSLKHLILKHVQYQLNEGDMDSAIELLNEVLSNFPDEIQFLKLKSMAFELDEDFESAVRLIYEIQYRTYDSHEKQLALQDARSLSRRCIDQLLNKGDWSNISELTKLVLSLDQDFKYAQFRLGEALLKQEKYVSASSEAFRLLDEPKWNRAGEQLLTEILAEKQNISQIQLKKIGQQYITNSLIAGTTEVSLLVDTGASICVLSKEVFERIKSSINANNVGDIPLNTAGGIVIVELYRIPSLQIGHHSVKNIEFAVNPYSNDLFDGLLGMNFLSMFNFRIDQQTNKLMLQDKK
tara:strand:- start:161 stop:1303 length:1143 start_codon:yes stop_codon:yes gene_type:complete